MGLEDQYKAFLANPTADLLAANASLTYIPTLTTISEPGAILKHIQVQNQQIKKKNEVVLHALETSNGLCVETETTFEFTNGGGVYLPGLDDHLLVGRTVIIVTVHVVTFNWSHKIERIRLLWDQGSLLKSIDIVGRSGRNWPLHTGVDQPRIIRSSVAGAMQPVDEAAMRPQVARTSSTIDDAVLQLFSPRTVDHQDSPRNPIAPRESAKPPPREYGELFNPAETPGDSSPSKRPGRKSGAGLNVSANRIFEQDDGTPSKPAKPSVKTNPDKFNHFEFDEPLPLAKVQSTRASNLGAQWDFEGFSTPGKVLGRTQLHNMRTFDIDNVGNTIPAETAKDQPISMARPDATAQYELKDVAPTAEHKTAKPQGRAAQLYEGHTFHDTHNKPASTLSNPDHGNVLGSITNAEQNRKTFKSNWAMSDDRDVINKDISDENERAYHPGQAKQKAIDVMQPSWQMFNNGPPLARGIRIAGNGMGGRLEVHESLPQAKGIRIAGNGMGGRLETNETSEGPVASKGIKIAGNGMGGRRGTSTLWEF